MKTLTESISSPTRQKDPKDVKDTQCSCGAQMSSIDSSNRTRYVLAGLNIKGKHKQLKCFHSESSVTTPTQPITESTLAGPRGLAPKRVQVQLPCACKNQVNDKELQVDYGVFNHKSRAHC